MTDLSRRDVLLGTAAVAASAALPAVPEAEFPTINEIVACVERPEIDVISVSRWLGTFVISPDMLKPGQWVVTKVGNDDV